MRLSGKLSDDSKENDREHFPNDQQDRDDGQEAIP